MARNILVVEDDRNISELIRMYLEKEGFEVRLAYDGGKAVEEYDKRAPDMVLLDIMLPVMDGWGVCAHIREKGKTPDHHADGQERCGRPHHRSGDGGRRLSGEAL